MKQDRQLHSHLHGALNAGASHADVDATLTELRAVLPADDADRAERLWKRVRGH
jgi:4-carboxymuconolactone decarboxylase